jgi:hypothetical protein
VVVEPVVIPKSSVTKIKLRGIIYYLSKASNELGEYNVYEYLEDQKDRVGRQVGRKNKDNKYILN